MADFINRRPTRYGGRRETALAVVLDCNNPDRVAEFWVRALGYIEIPITTPGAGPYRILIPADGDGIELLLQQVPEPKAGKNRMHFDLRVLDLDAEVERLIALGAHRLTPEPYQNVGWTWHILADPDGNEFCVLQPPLPDRDNLVPEHATQPA